MTSSLVGSEMCIRDSNYNHLPSGTVPLPDRSALKIRDSNQYQNVVNSSSVSYTHLTLPTICSV
eukprot:7793153-Prorocentrum_lima.AAC.1